MAKVTVDGNTRLIYADQLKFVAKGVTPLDFAADHVVILDGDGRVVAECWPIEREAGAPPPRPVPAATAAAPAHAVNGHGDGHGNGDGRLGKMTDAQRETLVRLCQDNPKGGPGRIGELFEKQTGRPVSVVTVLKYREDVANAGNKPGVGK